jgi:hypothetical protein
LVTEHPLLAARKRASHPPAAMANCRVPDRIDAHVERMQKPDADHALDRAVAEPKLQQLPVSDDTMLPGCQVRHGQLTWVL